jgi:ABC-type multidrug transport system fused ATPase/permease subunit
LFIVQRLVSITYDFITSISMKNEASVKETALQATDHSAGTTTSDEDKKKKKQKEARPMASLSETLAFVFQCGPRVQFLFVLGSIGGFFNGLVYPALAYLFSGSFSDISGASNSGLSQVRDLAYNFMIIGTFALVNGLIQTWCFEIVAYYASQNFRLSWFRALLRQDPAYFDVNDIGGLAAQVGPNSNKFRRGVGRKFGEGIQFATTGVGGLAFAFYVSWRVSALSGTCWNDPNRSAVNRSAVNRSAVNRSAVNRSAVNRSAVNRSAVNRSAVNRRAVNRSAVNRSAVPCW